MKSNVNQAFECPPAKSFYEVVTATIYWFIYSRKADWGNFCAFACHQNTVTKYLYWVIGTFFCTEHDQNVTRILTSRASTPFRGGLGEAMVPQSNLYSLGQLLNG